MTWGNENLPVYIPKCFHYRLSKIVLMHQTQSLIQLHLDVDGD